MEKPMLIADFDPSRDYDHGQIHVRLIHSTVDEMGDPRRGQQVGYWCDEAHAEHMLKALAWAVGQAREHREQAADQALLDKRLAETHDNALREAAEKVRRRAEVLTKSSPGCKCGCKLAGRELEYMARLIESGATKVVDEAVDAPF